MKPLLPEQPGTESSYEKGDAAPAGWGGMVGIERPIPLKKFITLGRRELSNLLAGELDPNPFRIVGPIE